MIIKGYYYNVMPGDADNIVKYRVSAWRPRHMKADQRHYLEIPKGGAWTIILCGRPYKKWGFYVNNHMWRPLRYFHKYGIIQTPEYQ